MRVVVSEAEHPRGPFGPGSFVTDGRALQQQDFVSASGERSSCGEAEKASTHYGEFDVEDIGFAVFCPGSGRVSRPATRRGPSSRPRPADRSPREAPSGGRGSPPHTR